jgi:acyl carrier protein
VAGLPDWLTRHRVEITQVVSSMLGPIGAAAHQSGLPSVRLLAVGGERLTRERAEAARRLLPPGGRLVYMYGATEATGICLNFLEGRIEQSGSPLPVGLAVPGVRVQVCGTHGEPVPPGTPGEVVVTSPYLPFRWLPDHARNGPPPPEREPASRSLRTGDFGLIGPDGLLTLVGRRDRMVKIRGYRVELEAVERALLALEPVREAVVVDLPVRRGGRVLAAYLVLQDPDRSDALPEIRRALRSTLPAFMVPSRLAVLDALPLLPNGKVDLRTLAAAGTAGEEHPRDPSPSETEELLKEIWCAALELDDVGRDADFFELGGDSLAAAVVAAELYFAFGIEIELRSLVEHSSVASMARLVDELQSGAAHGDDLALERQSGDDPSPLSFAQERTWRFARTPEGVASYVMTRASWIHGPLDVAAFRAAVEGVFARHEMMRTTFEERDGRPVQVVHPPGPVEIPLIDVTSASDPEEEARRLLARESEIPFDLRRGPLLRLRLVRLGKDEYQLIQVHHHLVTDGWSWSVFFDEVGLLYEAQRSGRPSPLLDELPVQYGDFAVWERRRLDRDSERYRQEVDAWRRAFQDLPPPLQLPFTRPAPKDDASPSEGVIFWGLAPELSEDLEALARESRATYYMLRLGIFGAQLALETGQHDIVLGSYVTNRRRLELQQMFGYFANLTTLRLGFAPDLTAREWIRRVRTLVTETGARAEIPYEQLAEELRDAGTPVPEIRAIFSTVGSGPPLRFDGLEITPAGGVYPAMPWGFSIGMDRFREADLCGAVFDARIYDPEGVRRFLEGYKRLAAELVARPDVPLSELNSAEARIAPAGS